MKILVLLLLVANISFARTIYGVDGVQVVSPDNKNMSFQVAQLSTGVCSIGKNGNASMCCSGFLVAPNLVITNYHCLTCINKSVQGQPDPFISAVSSFFRKLVGKKPDPEGSEYDKLIKEKGIVRALNENYAKDFTGINLHHIKGSNKSKIVKIVELVEADEALDFSLVRIEKEIEENAEQHIFSLTRRPVETGMPLLNIGHPGDSPAPGHKVYDETDECRVASTDAPLGIKKQVFGHQCDTNGGSSGSPIIEKETGNVIGLHFSGGAREKKVEGYHLTMNRAVKMDAILDYLKEKNPEAYELLRVW